MDKLFFGLSVMLLGIATVFLGLVILIGAIKLVSLIIGATNKPKGTKTEDAPVNAAPAAAPAPAVIETVPAPAENTQLIAVIAAALAAYQENGKRLVVRSVRRIGARSAWSDAGRREQLN